MVAWLSTPERTERVVELTRQGLSTPVIAELLGVSDRTVCRHRVRAGIAQPGQVPLSEDERRRALSLLEDGASLSEVARTLGRSITPMRRHFSAYKWTKQQSAEFSAVGRAMAELERKAAIA